MLSLNNGFSHHWLFSFLHTLFNLVFCRKQLELQCLSHFRSFKSLFVEFICLCHSFPSFPLSPKLQFYSKCAEKSPLGPDSYLNQRHRPKKWKRSERGEADYWTRGHHTSIPFCTAAYLSNKEERTRCWKRSILTGNESSSSWVSSICLKIPWSHVPDAPQINFEMQVTKYQLQLSSDPRKNGRTLKKV